MVIHCLIGLISVISANSVKNFFCGPLQLQFEIKIGKACVLREHPEVGSVVTVVSLKVPSAPVKGGTGPCRF